MGLFRRLMMQSVGSAPLGLKYVTGTVTQSSDDQYLSVTHNLGTANVVGLVRKQSPAGSVNSCIGAAVWPQAWRTVLLGESDTIQNTVLLNNTRSTAAADSYPAVYSKSIASTITSVTFESSYSTYPFKAGTYDYIIIATDVFDANGLTYDFDDLIKTSGTSIVLPNNLSIDSSSLYLCLVQAQTPTYGVNGVVGAVIAGRTFNDPAGNVKTGIFVNETRTSWATYSQSYSTSSISYGTDTITIAPRNNSYPWQNTDYNYYLIKLPDNF